eukprot:1206643-Prymnesium_polylepis.1
MIVCLVPYTRLTHTKAWTTRARRVAIERIVSAVAFASSCAPRSALVRHDPFVPHAASVFRLPSRRAVVESA